MPRPKNVVPTYRKHQKSGRAVIDVRRQDGGRTTISLGPWGSPESRTEYARYVALLAASGGSLPAPGRSPGACMTVGEVVSAFVQEKADRDFVDAQGKPTSQHSCYTLAVRPLLRLYGGAIAAEFGARELETLQLAMATGSWLTDAEREARARRSQPVGWCRRNANRSVSRLRSLFKWAALRGLVPTAVVASLACVPPLKPGRAGVREKPPVRPVEAADFEAALPHLPPVVADVVRFLWLTGCRVGEALSMRPCDIDRTRETWEYRPASHKGVWRGQVRAIAIGPQARMLVHRNLPDDEEGYVFSPIRQAALIAEAKRARRVSKIPPSQENRRVAAPKRQPGARFEPTAINRAVARACKAAGIKAWHVHMLRHAAALRIEREHGAEAARAVLGHASLNLTLLYSGLDAKRAAEVAAACG